MWLRCAPSIESVTFPPVDRDVDSGWKPWNVDIPAFLPCQTTVLIATPSGLIHTGRVTRREANGACCHQWDYSHCTQARSKEKRSNLHARRSRVLCELGLINHWLKNVGYVLFEFLVQFGA